MSKKTKTQAKKKTQAEEDLEFIKFLESDEGTKFLGDEKKLRKIMDKTDKFLGI